MNTGQWSDNTPFREAYKKADFTDRAALVLSIFLGAGIVPVAPGTFGTLAALAPVALIKYLGGPSEYIFFIILTSLALWSSHIARKCLAKDDPPEVVIDEAAGFCLSVFLLPFTFLNLCLGFLLFRFFDILKPFPIGLIDKRVKGGLGIVLDDIVAGVFANISMRIILVLIYLVGLSD